MLKKLKIKMMSIAILLIGVILFSIFSGIYVFMIKGDAQRSDLLLDSIEARENGAKPQPPDLHFFPKSFEIKSFFVRLDKSGNIIKKSDNFDNTNGSSLLNSILANKEPEGIINTSDMSIRYRKTTYDDGIFIAIINRSAERAMLDQFLMISIMAGVISLFLVFLISWYLASKSIAPVAKAWAKQTEFVADASHELRTPLAVISANLDAVTSCGEDTINSQSKWLNNINLEVRRMSKLVENLLFLARSDIDSSAIPKSEFDLSIAVCNLTDTFELLMAEKKVEFNLSISPDVLFMGNENQMKQVIAILLDNALKHSEENGIISLSLIPKSNEIIISVTDNGEGIAKEHIDKVFERFYRVDEARSRSHDGYGLGLSIAKQIVEFHKGKISVVSVPMQYTTFTITLPKVI